jgi:hypothetical protein
MGTWLKREQSKLLFEDFHLEDEARIWPCLPHVCHIRLTAEGKSAPVYFVSFLWCACAFFRSKVDGAVPRSLIGGRWTPRRRMAPRCLTGSTSATPILSSSLVPWPIKSRPPHPTTLSREKARKSG